MQSVNALYTCSCLQLCATSSQEQHFCRGHSCFVISAILQVIKKWNGHEQGYRPAKGQWHISLLQMTATLTSFSCGQSWQLKSQYDVLVMITTVRQLWCCLQVWCTAHWVSRLSSSQCCLLFPVWLATWHTGGKAWQTLTPRSLGPSRTTGWVTPNTN